MGEAVKLPKPIQTKGMDSFFFFELQAAFGLAGSLQAWIPKE